MAASVSSLGPPSAGPGSSSETVGFTLSSTSRSRAYSNREPVSGNPLCHKNNVERNYARHENRLASVKAYLSLSAPVRPDFMKRQLSKRFHLRRHHERIVVENLKLLRALEGIHSREGVGYPGENDCAWSQDKLTPGCGIPSIPSVNATGNKRALSRSSKQTSSRNLNTLVRKRIVTEALVAIENKKMEQRMKQCKSLYSREKMREHRRRHLRVLRLRKTDYTVGHLLSTNTATRYWKGGDFRDEGFSYSFEEGRGHSRRRGTQSNHRDRRGNTNCRASLPVSRAIQTASAHATRRSSYCHSPSPKGNTGPRKKGSGQVDVKSAPRLPSLPSRGDICVGGNPLGCPNLEQCRMAKEKLSNNAGGGRGSDDGGWNNVGSMALSRNNAEISNHQEDGGKKRRPSPDGAVLEGVSSRRESLRHRPFRRSVRSSDSFDERTGGGSGVGSTGARRGTESSKDSLSRPQSSWASSDTNSSMESGSHRSRRFQCREGDRVEENAGDSEKQTADENIDKADENKIFKTFTRPDENCRFRVLVQTTKPLKALNHASGIWICFFSVLVKDPFDDQLDVRVIHGREEVCRRVLSLEEAKTICEGKEEKKTVVLRNPSLVGEVLPIRGEAASTPELGATPAAVTSSRSSTVSHTLEEGASASLEKSTGRRASHGVKQRLIEEDSLSDQMMGLFAAADTAGKGYLAPEQLRTIMLQANLGLSGPELQLVIAEADKNADGNIDYYEFVPMAHNLARAFRARKKAHEEMQDERLDLDQQAIQALNDAEFDRTVRQLKDLCQKRDVHSSGALSRTDFMQCISEDRCRLTSTESKLLLDLLPEDSQGNVVYHKLGAGLEQARFTTLRQSISEAAASDTQRYLMFICREEDFKSESLKNKTDMISTGDAVTVDGKQYSGLLRARQLTKLLLDAPLLGLSSLHITVIMNQAHIVDGMVNYVKLVPMMAKTIEGIFHPQNLKMRHIMFKMNGVGGGWDGAGAKGAGLGGDGDTSARVSGKTRDDVQKVFVDVLRDEKLKNGFERLKDPATSAKCMTALGLDVESDMISTLWEATGLGDWDNVTFVDMVDFCLNCVLFLEREKQVTSSEESKVDITFLDKTQVLRDSKEDDDSTVDSSKEDDAKEQPSRDINSSGGDGEPNDGVPSVKFVHNDQLDGTDEDRNTTTGGSILTSVTHVGRTGTTARTVRAKGLHLQPAGGPDLVILVHTRRKVPFVSSSYRTITRSTTIPTTITNLHGTQVSLESEASLRSVPKPQRKESHESGPSVDEHKAQPGPDSICGDDLDFARKNTKDMDIYVYWEGVKRDHAFVEACVAEGTGRSGEHRNRLRLGVRVPTLAIVDAQAAAKFAERVAEQVAIQVDIDNKPVKGKVKELRQDKNRGRSKEEMRLRLLGVDTKAVYLAK